MVDGYPDWVRSSVDLSCNTNIIVNKFPYFFFIRIFFVDDCEYFVMLPADVRVGERIKDETLFLRRKLTFSALLSDSSAPLDGSASYHRIKKIDCGFKDTDYNITIYEVSYPNEYTNRSAPYFTLGVTCQLSSVLIQMYVVSCFSLDEGCVFLNSQYADKFQRGR